MSKTDIKSLEFDELQQRLTAMGLPRFRTAQLFDWLHSKNVREFSEMTNLSAQLRAKLEEEFYINNINISKKLVSGIDNTVKYLYTLRDGECVEAVVMRYHHGNSICISSEVGCKMGCTFCASTKAGFVRRLSASEMLDEIAAAEHDLGERVSNVVLMGIGEPLDNYDNLIAFLHILSDERGRNLGLRHVTLSTCGLVDNILRLAGEGLPVTLSVSLHAPNDRLRAQTMPVNNRYPIRQLLDACRVYADRTHRRVTFEYACIHGVNDSLSQADELAELLRGMLCHVNLIPVNPIRESGNRPPDARQLERFAGRLEKRGIPVTVRRTLGQDINAACGQLRRDSMAQDSNK